MVKVHWSAFKCAACWMHWHIFCLNDTLGWVILCGSSSFLNSHLPLVYLTSFNLMRSWTAEWCHKNIDPTVCLKCLFLTYILHFHHMYLFESCFYPKWFDVYILTGKFFFSGESNWSLKLLKNLYVQVFWRCFIAFWLKVLKCLTSSKKTTSNPSSHFWTNMDVITRLFPHHFVTHIKWVFLSCLTIHAPTIGLLGSGCAVLFVRV